MRRKLFFVLVLLMLTVPIYAETYTGVTIKRINLPIIARANENVSVIAEIFADNSTFVNATLVVGGKFVERKIVHITDNENVEFNYMHDSSGRKRVTIIAEVFGGSDEKSRTIFVYSINQVMTMFVVLMGAVVYYYFYYRKWIARTEPEEFKLKDVVDTA